ncbi:TPA: crossover junction endodeoxyribonuclease RuvC [Candidatus Nomurabacteria bacterium]|nr:MAG: Holliday junction resolvase [Parcubacteria bacterium RAAC4_OD1_1]HCY26196.1 crossover junction endodeoxyribonuclease RuvC [Candidatus Nomurabacteria bacterium]
MKILSVDPGFERVGIAIINKEKNKEKEELIYSDCFKTSAKISFHERLLLIGKEISRVIKEYKPESLAIEKLYFTTNQKTVMGVSEARGIIIYVAKENGLHTFEYTPPQIKIAVTGYGKSDKNMVMSMVPKLIKINKIITSDDELDAIAIGLTCFAHEKFKL